MKRAELRAAAQRLPYSALEWLRGNPACPHMHRAEARREMKRRDRAQRRWFAQLIGRLGA